MMRRNPDSYMIPLQFPVERYVYGPDIDVAHWTSSPVWSQGVLVRNNPGRRYVRANPDKYTSVSYYPAPERSKHPMADAKTRDELREGMSWEQWVTHVQQQGEDLPEYNVPKPWWQKAYDKITGKPNPRKKKVPTHIKKTPRSAALDISAIGKYNHWPIGDLYHARLAMIYALSPSNSKVADKVISSVKKHYPQYDWDRWLEEHEEAHDKRMAANPRSRRR